MGCVLSRIRRGLLGSVLPLFWWAIWNTIVYLSFWKVCLHMIQALDLKYSLMRIYFLSCELLCLTSASKVYLPLFYLVPFWMSLIKWSVMFFIMSSTFSFQTSTLLCGRKQQQQQKVIKGLGQEGRCMLPPIPCEWELLLTPHLDGDEQECFY